MPTIPSKPNRPWKFKAKKHQRSVDMSWFYNSWKWRKFSKRYKRENPLCIKCKQEGIITAATVTDHITRYADGGEGFDLNNLKPIHFQSLCDFHHNQKSGKEAHGYKENKGGMG